MRKEVKIQSLCNKIDEHIHSWINHLNGETQDRIAKHSTAQTTRTLRPGQTFENIK